MVECWIGQADRLEEVAHCTVGMSDMCRAQGYDVHLCLWAERRDVRGKCPKGLSRS